MLRLPYSLEIKKRLPSLNTGAGKRFSFLLNIRSNKYTKTGFAAGLFI